MYVSQTYVCGTYIFLNKHVPYNKDELQDIIHNLNLPMSDSIITSDHLFHVTEYRYQIHGF
jgi:hypothetical protein